MQMTKLQLIVNTFWAITTVIVLFVDIQTESLLNQPNFLWGYVLCMVASFGVVTLIEKKRGNTQNK